MTIKQFCQTLAEETAPEGISAPLRALWHDAKGNWAAAHAIAQEIDDRTGSWVHAYLHRKEGDLGNAGYWYRRAGQPTAGGTVVGLGIVGVLSNGLNILQVNSYVQQVLTGVIIVLAVSLSRLSRRRA